MGAFWLAVRGGEDAVVLVPRVRRAVAAVDPALRLDDVASIDHAGWDERAFFLGIGSCLLALGAVTLLLAAAGLYAILAFAVSRRTREIGIRVACGATRADVLSSVLGRSLARLALGAVLGWALAQGLGPLARAFNGLPEPMPWMTGLVIAAMLAAGTTACWVPALRALRIRPVDALRTD
jgi:ABC-type antimicrobial peptide transport system permease subunit